MKKIFLMLGLIMTITLFCGCQKSAKSSTKMLLNGVEYDEKFVKSGYYFDKASMSDATLGDNLSRVEVIEKPTNLGVTVLPDFSKIELENNKKEEITSAMIEAEIEKERDKETTFTPVKTKREAKMTDKVIIDFKGYVDGEELEGGTGKDFELILGSGQFIPGFEEQVAGHKAGIKFSIDVTFPNEYTPELAGKPAKFDVTIKSMEEATTPEFNDEFVKNHTTKGSTTVDEFKEEIKQKLENKNDFMNKQNLVYQLYDKISSEAKFEPTEEALAWCFSVMINQMKQSASQNGTDFVEMLKSNGGTIRDAYDSIKSSIPEYIQQEMIMDELSKRYKVDITEEEVKKWFDTTSEMMGYGAEITYDDYKEYMGYDNMLKAAMQDKSLQLATQDCKIVDYDESEEE